MFRYIGFSWAPSCEVPTELASRLADRLKAAGWRGAFSSAGLKVYITGNRRGVNDSYLLPSGGGLVLGRLFRRHETSTPHSCDIELTDQEADRIVRSDGQALIDHFWGRWIAFLPSWTGEARVLRDPTGTLPCYRLELEGLSIAFSWLEDLIDLMGIARPAINWDAVAAVLVFGRLGGRETALDGVSQVLPGELTVLSTRPTPARPLWRAIDVARRPVDPDLDLAARMLRDVTTQCIRSWMACYDNIVLRLSGGVDSAILLGCLFSPAPTASVLCLNYFSPGSDSDERRYARLAATRVGCPLVERQRDLGFHLGEVMNPALTPAPGSYIGRMGSDRMDAEVARAHEAPVIFTGAGGDQLFEEVRCTWTAADYLQLRGVDRGFPAAVLDAARLGEVSFWKSLRLAFRDRFATHDPMAGAGQYVTLVPRSVIEATLERAQRFIHPGLLEAFDLPIGKLAQLRALISPFDYYNPFAAATSPELVHPLMSQPLLELSLALPTYLLTCGGRGRGLARESFADRLPPEIAVRRSKGGTEEHVTSVLQRSLPLARHLLLDGELARRALLDRPRVEATLAGRPSTSDAYVTEVHTCIAVETWLQRVANVRSRPVTG